MPRARAYYRSDKSPLRRLYEAICAHFRHVNDHEYCPCDSCVERRVLESYGGG